MTKPQQKSQTFEVKATTPAKPIRPTTVVQYNHPKEMSKLGGAKVEVVRAAPVPLFRRKLNCFMRRKPGMTLSQKDLLMSGVVLEVDACTTRKSFSSTECSFTSPEKGDIWEQDDGEEDNLVEAAEPGGEKDEQEEVGRRISDFDPRFAFHGSPSFRVYCRNSTENDEDSECFRASTSDDVDSTAPAAEPEVLNSNEGKMTRESKRDKCRRKFQGVLRKGRPMRHLLNVTSCYNPMSSRPSHRKMPDRAHSA